MRVTANATLPPRASLIWRWLRCPAFAFAVAAALAACSAQAAVSQQDPRTRAGLIEFGQARFAEALQDWQAAAADGDAAAELYVGVLYDTGLGVPGDPAQAAAWYRRAADAGSEAGALNLGVLYDSGVGMARDQAEAVRWYALAATRGSARAAYDLALICQDADSAQHDTARAIKLFRQAARAGISAAYAHLVALHAVDVPAASAGPPPATDVAMQNFRQAQLLLLQRGPREAAHAAELFGRAAAQHNALAEYDLGYCYERGIGVAIDAAQARDWYGRAAADGAEPLRTIANGSLDRLRRGAAGSSR